MTKSPEVRLNDDGTLDDVVAFGAFFHLEQMSDNSWWLCVDVGGQRIDVWMRSRAKITAEHITTPTGATP